MTTLHRLKSGDDILISDDTAALVETLNLLRFVLRDEIRTLQAHLNIMHEDANSLVYALQQLRNNMPKG